MDFENTPDRSDTERDLMGAADAFMTRLRPPAEDDVPLLTDVVEGPAPAASASAAPTLTAEAQAALSRELEDWLDMHLTEAVLRVLDGVADHLVERITREAREDLLPRLQAALARPSTAQTPPSPPQD
ncbi:MAG: hypothetical protein EKK46_04265 [Rhodocyclaceae bacterium]|nr:MAG: hypothetical protein EKK46_04265 [Rhodocyclaceae bacterium]